MFVAGLVVGGLLVRWWAAHDRAAVRELRRAAEQRARGDWRRHVPPAAVGNRASRDVRDLVALFNKVAERTLRRLKDLTRQSSDLRAIVDALPDPLILADTRRRVILINAPAAELLGVGQSAALGQSLEATVSEPAVLTLFDRVAAIDLNDTNYDGTPLLPLRRPVRLSRGGRPLAFQAVATRSGAGGVLVVLRDISTLDATLRMKADFVANAGHELRTPLAAIKAAYETLIDVLDDEPAADPALGRCTSIMGDHLRRLEEMLGDLMDLSRVEGGEQRPTWELVTPLDLTRDLRQTLGPAAAEKEIALDLPAGDGTDEPFVADFRLLMLAVKNLVENAVKYTPPGGRVSLEIGRHDLPAAAAEMHRRLTGRPYHEVRLIVRDTGVGIAPEHLGRVFERFYQVGTARTGTNARTSGRGTGLGLSIVKHAVGAMGGSVAVESEQGVGSTFTVILPQIRNAAAAAA